MERWRLRVFQRPHSRAALAVRLILGGVVVVAALFRWVHCPQDYHPRLNRWFCIEHAAACDLFDDPLGRKTINRRLPAGWKRDLSPAKLSFILIHGAFVSYNLSLLA